MKKEKFSHIAWDSGVLDFLPKPKTIRTHCMQRVPIAQIDNLHPTCPQCIYDRDEEERLLKELQDENPSLSRDPATTGELQ